jgi:site-specific DNA recombinase
MICDDPRNFRITPLRSRDLGSSRTSPYDSRAEQQGWRPATGDRQKLGNVTGEISRLLDAIASGAVAARAVGGKFADLEAEQDRLEQERATVGLDPVEFYPNAADVYRAKIRSLKRTLSEAGEKSRLCRYLRDCKVVIHPGGKYQPPEIETFGQLAVILKLSEAAATQES